MLGLIGGAIGAGLQLPFQIGNMFMQHTQHHQDMMLQRDLMNQQVQAQKDINDQNIQFVRSENEINRQREDTAIQRGVADAKAAGLSPLAGIGGASSTYASAPQAQAPDIGSFAGNMASLSTSSAQMMSSNIANLTQTLGSIPANIMQLEGFAVQNNKAQADLEAQTLENVYNAAIAKNRVDRFNDETLSAKAQRELDEYITKKVKDLKLYPSNFTSGTANHVRTLLDTVVDTGDMIHQQVAPMVDEIKRKAEESKKKRDAERRRRSEERKKQGGWKSHLPEWFPFF